MRDQEVYRIFNMLAQNLQILENSVRLGVTGESIRNQAMQDVLIKKGLATEADFTEAIGQVIKKAQEAEAARAKEAEAAKPTLVTPTPQEVTAVEKGTLETAPVVPPPTNA